MLQPKCEIDRHSLVREHFREDCRFWKEVYVQNTLNGELYRERRACVLRFVDQLHLAPGAKVLDVGCGAGLIAVELAKKDLVVEAVDAAPEMVQLTKQAVRFGGVSGRVAVRSGDVRNLCFARETFDLVVAVGVMEWMSSLVEPLAELHRVLRPGGFLIVNVDNAHALHCLLDPRMTPIAAPVKRVGRRLAETSGLIPRAARPVRCSRAKLDDALRRACFSKVEGITCGFGPFTFAGTRILSDRAGIRLHHTFQKMANRRTRFIRSGGDTYLVLAQKRASQSKGLALV